jgi:hypothetical protein
VTERLASTLGFAIFLRKEKKSKQQYERHRTCLRASFLILLLLSFAGKAMLTSSGCFKVWRGFIKVPGNMLVATAVGLLERRASSKENFFLHCLFQQRYRIIREIVCFFKLWKTKEGSTLFKKLNPIFK